MSAPDFHNPYSAGGIVGQDSNTVFVGREQLLSDLLRFVTGPRPGIRSIYGLRRIGKTSLLHRLQTMLPKGTPCAYIDILTLRGQAVSISDFSARLAAEFAQSLGRQSDPSARWPSMPALLTDGLPSMLADAEHPPVLLLDELEAFGLLTGFDDANTLSPATLYALLGGSANPFCCVLSFGRPESSFQNKKIEALQGILKSGLVIRLGLLENGESEELITAPLAGRISWQAGAIDRLKRLSGHHPLFLQALLGVVVDHVLSGQIPAAHIPAEAVDAVAEATRLSLSDQIKWALLGLDVHKVVLLHCLAAASGAAEEAVDEATIESMLATVLPAGGMARQFWDNHSPVLREWGLIVVDADGRWSVGALILQRYLATCDLQSVLDSTFNSETSGEKAEAEQIYDAGDKIGAFDIYLKIIEANPYRFDVRRTAVRICIEMNRPPDEAIRLARPIAREPTTAQRLLAMVDDRVSFAGFFLGRVRWAEQWQKQALPANDARFAARHRGVGRRIAQMRGLARAAHLAIVCALFALAYFAVAATLMQVRIEFADTQIVNLASNFVSLAGGRFAVADWRGGTTIFGPKNTKQVVCAARDVPGTIIGSSKLKDIDRGSKETLRFLSYVWLEDNDIKFYSSTVDQKKDGRILTDTIFGPVISSASLDYFSPTISVGKMSYILVADQVSYNFHLFGLSATGMEDLTTEHLLDFLRRLAPGDNIGLNADFGLIAVARNTPAPLPLAEFSIDDDQMVPGFQVLPIVTAEQKARQGQVPRAIGNTVVFSSNLKWIASEHDVRFDKLPGTGGTLVDQLTIFSGQDGKVYRKLPFADVIGRIAFDPGETYIASFTSKEGLQLRSIVGESAIIQLTPARDATAFSYPIISFSADSKFVTTGRVRSLGTGGGRISRWSIAGESVHCSESDRSPFADMVSLNWSMLPFSFGCESYVDLGEMPSLLAGRVLGDVGIDRALQRARNGHTLLIDDPGRGAQIMDQIDTPQTRHVDQISSGRALPHLSNTGDYVFVAKEYEDPFRIEPFVTNMGTMQEIQLSFDSKIRSGVLLRPGISPETVLFSPTDDWLVAWSERSTVLNVWKKPFDAMSHAIQLQVKDGDVNFKQSETVFHTGEIYTAKFSPDGGSLAVLTSDHAVSLYETKNWTLKKQIQLSALGQSSSIPGQTHHDTLFRPDGRGIIVLVGSTIVLADLDGAGNLQTRVRSHNADIGGGAVNADGILATFDGSGVVALTDTANGQSRAFAQSELWGPGEAPQKIAWLDWLDDGVTLVLATVPDENATGSHWGDVTIRRLRIHRRTLTGDRPAYRPWISSVSHLVAAVDQGSAYANR